MDGTNIAAFTAEYTALCIKYGLVICLHCRKVHAKASMKSRGLCKVCYNDNDIRSGYAFRRRGGWTDGSRAWDVLDKAMLIDLLAAKLTDRQIAGQMNRTERAVGKARRRLGITRERYTGKLHWPSELGDTDDHD